MTTQPSPDPSPDTIEADKRLADGDRRAEDRRRSAKGLFELRAKRDRIVEDRRQQKRRTHSRFRLAFWRRSDA